MSLSHRQSKTKLYRIWLGMCSRCECQGDTNYQYYGARGIAVCREWRTDFTVFRNWAMANGYAEKMTIDRFPDKTGNYGPQNCRWVTHQANCRNRRSNVMVEAFGEIKTLIQWCEDSRCLVGYATLNQRIQKYGWTAERALSTPLTMYGGKQGRVIRSWKVPEK